MLFSPPFLDLYCTPLIVPFVSSSEVTVPCSNLTLQEMDTDHHQITRNTELKHGGRINDECLTIQSKHSNFSRAFSYRRVTQKGIKET